ncbi:MAG: cation diffusion facilitator family transporter [Thermodesulfobacteriota bacterium]|nr:cation diffusion facilitator family transporter [Thermodesulfobacteriota bacterium]
MTSNKSKQDLLSARHRAAVSIGVNIALAVGKGVAGVASSSTALIGDAINSATDVLASFAAFVGLWVAGREHPSFPYGLYKAETVATLVTSIAIIVAAYEIGRQAIFGAERLPDVAIALPVAAVSLIVSLLFGLYQSREGKRLNSPALKADARDYLTDALSTGVVFIGLLATKFGYAVDRWAAVVVSLFVFRAGSALLVTALKDLLDASIDRETEREIIQMVEQHPRISRVKQCLSRTAGGRYIVDMDVVMHTPSHRIADHVADRLEELIPQKFPLVVMARIRPHYSADTVVRRLTPVTRPEGEPSPHFVRSPWFLIETIDTAKPKVLKREFVENQHADAERKKGLLVGNWLLSLKPDEVIVPDGHNGTAVVLLREAGVEIRSAAS